MRLAGLLLLPPLAASAQFKSTVPLVVSPVTVTDSDGRFINGLTAADLVIYNNSVPQKVQAQVVEERISLAVSIQASPNAAAVLDKPGRTGAMFSEYDAVLESIHLLDHRDPKRRRILLAIAQTRDQGSKTKLDTLPRDPAPQNTTILGGHTPEYDEGLPPDYAPGNLFNIFTSAADESKVNSAALLSGSTGGRTWGFPKQKGLEEAIHAVASEAHQQYIVTFEPKPDEPGLFHALSAEVKGRPELRVRTRTGYWSVR